MADHPADADSLRVALRLGQRWGAHVKALYTAVDSRDAVAFLGEGMTAGMIEKVMEASAADCRVRDTRCHEIFEAAVTAVGVPRRADPPVPGGGAPQSAYSASYEHVVGREDEIVAERGRMADLIVMPRPFPDAGPSPVLEAALRDTGRPVFVVPQGIAPDGFGQRVAVGWNGSIECTRALTAALPFLSGASEVHVLGVEPERNFGPPALAVVDYLAWHGVPAAHRIVQPDPAGPGKALLRVAQELNADMLVIGAYSRSQMRRLIFGGVTAEVLVRSPIPALMMH
ncbi:MAG: universal stress protein [Sneathiellaceae bacterium]